MTSEHYLISLPTNDGVVVHAYLVTTDKTEPMRVCNLMLDTAEKQGLHIGLPVILQTILEPSGVKVVETFISEDPAVRELLQTHTGHHISVFMSLDETSQPLMDLH